MHKSGENRETGGTSDSNDKTFSVELASLWPEINNIHVVNAA